MASWKRVGYEEGYGLGLDIGFEQAQFMKKVATRLYYKGFPFNVIAEIFEISVETLRVIIAIDDSVTYMKINNKNKKTPIDDFEQI